MNLFLAYITIVPNVKRVWSSIPFFNKLSPDHTHRGFPVSQTVTDIFHVLIESMVFLNPHISSYVPECIVIYFGIDLAMHSSVFISNLPYLAHHLLGIGTCCIGRALSDRGILRRCDVSHVAFFMELGLIPILLADTMKAFHQKPKTWILVMRPLVYALTRLETIRIVVSYDWMYFAYLAPIMAHNAWVLRLQLKALGAHLDTTICSS